MKVYYFVTAEHGNREFIGMDSGGYLWNPSGPHGIHWFNSIEDAAKFKLTWSDSKTYTDVTKWTLMEITL